MTTKTPILRIGSVLIASIQVALDDHSVRDFQQELLQRVSDEGATGAIIDLTAVDLVDSFMARSLNETATAMHLLGAQLAIVGIQPAVAMTLVEMGLMIPNAISTLNLEKGLELLRKRSESAVRSGTRVDSSDPTASL